MARAADGRGPDAHRDIEGLIGSTRSAASKKDDLDDLPPGWKSSHELDVEDEERERALRREYRTQQRQQTRAQNQAPAGPGRSSSSKGAGPSRRSAPSKDRVRRTAGARRPSSSSSRRRRPGRPTFGDPTGGRVPLLSFDGEGLGGLFVGAVAYALLLSIVNYGPKGPGLWFKAKFLNQATAKGSATATAAPASSSPPINLA